MNIFGFLATIVGCLTAFGIVWLITKKPLTFKIVKVVEIPKQPEKTGIQETQETTKEPEPNREPEVEVISMDAVIKNANELMGIITTAPKEDK